MSRKLRVAIVGGGAAALGVLSGAAAAHADLDIVLIDLPPASSSPSNVSFAQSSTEPAAITPALVRDVRNRLGWRFPPPKSHFGVSPPAIAVEHWGEIWRGAVAGGLTQYWGGSALPYPDEEFAAWPFPASELRGHYEAIVREIPISGAEDALSRLWSGGLSSRPALARCRIFDRLIEHLQRPSEPRQSYELIAGAGRMAVETAPSSPQRCRLDGRCMLGCPHDAVFAAVHTIRGYRDAGLVNSIIEAEVRSFDPRRRTLSVLSHGRMTELGPFDLVFLAAGCVESTTIVLRSLPGIEGVQMQDNSVHSFPLLYFGRFRTHPAERRYFGLTNAVIACRPLDGGPLSVIQLYPFFDYLWQYHLPSWLWSSAGVAAAFARDHVAIARLYLPAEHSQRYSLALSAKGEPVLALAAAPTPLEQIPNLWSAVRRRLSGRGFWVPPALRSSQRTSSHYAATLPAGGSHCSSYGEIAERFYLCDSAAFPASSAFSPTLTIMAVARKRAMEAVERFATANATIPAWTRKAPLTS